MFKKLCAIKFIECYLDDRRKQFLAIAYTDLFNKNEKLAVFELNDTESMYDYKHEDICDYVKRHVLRFD